MEDVLKFFDRYGIFLSITGNAVSALCMCLIMGALVYLISYVLTGAIFDNVEYFKGIDKLMGWVRGGISGVITAGFYYFLRVFQFPLSFVYQWRYYIGTPLLLAAIIAIVGFAIYGIVMSVLYPKPDWMD